jgi:FtsP/CotA-like multicopper oxidase with cupredoxin domain
VPVAWNVVPNGHNAIEGDEVSTADSVMHTVVYRRSSENWGGPEENAPRSSADGLLIPGPLIQARVGHHLRIHLKNMDTLHHAPHSMHFHGVHYTPSSDGEYVPGFSARDAKVMPGKTYTYRLDAAQSVWSTSSPPRRTALTWYSRQMGFRRAAGPVR